MLIAASCARHWSIATATITRMPVTIPARADRCPASVQPVAQHAHDQRADQRAEDRAAPAEQARAADHHGGDAVEIGRLQRVRIGVRDASERDTRRRCRRGSRRTCRPTASAPRTRMPTSRAASRVIADRIEMPSPARLRQQVPDRAIEQERRAPRRTCVEKPPTRNPLPVQLSRSSVTGKLLPSE